MIDIGNQIEKCKNLIRHWTGKSYPDKLVTCDAHITGFGNDVDFEAECNVCDSLIQQYNTIVCGTLMILAFNGTNEKCIPNLLEMESNVDERELIQFYSDCQPNNSKKEDGYRLF